MTVIYRLTNLCYDSLNSYPRTLSEERKLLKRQDLNKKVRSALKVVIEEKQTLLELADLCKEIMEVLVMKKGEAIKLVTTDGKKRFKGAFKYLRDEIVPMLEREIEN